MVIGYLKCMQTSKNGLLQLPNYNQLSVYSDHVKIANEFSVPSSVLVSCWLAILSMLHHNFLFFFQLTPHGTLNNRAMGWCTPEYPFLPFYYK